MELKESLRPMSSDERNVSSLPQSLDTERACAAAIVVTVDDDSSSIGDLTNSTDDRRKSSHIKASRSITTRRSLSTASTGSSSNNVLFQRTVYVGNLSYFCRESDLFDLFEPLAVVQEVRVVRNEQRSRSLSYGFVTLETIHEANEMQRLLDGTFFMGRRLAVASRSERRPSHIESGTSVHVAFVSSPDPSDTAMVPVCPTESWLRKRFAKYGVILDCHVKEYKQNKSTSRYEGYGFIWFAVHHDALKAIQEVQNVEIDGVLLKCKMGHSSTTSNDPPPPSTIAPNTRAPTYFQHPTMPAVAHVAPVMQHNDFLNRQYTSLVYYPVVVSTPYPVVHSHGTSGSTSVRPSHEQNIDY